MKKIGKKWQMKAGETRADILDRIGGSGGGARRVSKKAKTNVSKTGKADSTASGARDAEAERLYGDWLKKGGKPRKDMMKGVDKASRKNMKKMMSHPDYGKKYTFSKRLKKMVGLK